MKNCRRVLVFSRAVLLPADGDEYVLRVCLNPRQSDLDGTLSLPELTQRCITFLYFINEAQEGKHRRAQSAVLSSDCLLTAGGEFRSQHVIQTSSLAGSRTWKRRKVPRQFFIPRLADIDVLQAKITAAFFLRMMEVIGSSAAAGVGIYVGGLFGGDPGNKIIANVMEFGIMDRIKVTM